MDNIPIQPPQEHPHASEPGPVDQPEATSEKRYVMYRGILTVLAIAIFLIIVFGIIGIFYSKVFLILVNVLWILLISITVIFLFLGVLVMLGLKKEAAKILDVLFEGSLNIIDLADFVKMVITNFILLLKEFILKLVPFIAIALGILIFFVLLYFYKWFGQDKDITVVTIVLTILLVATLGLIDKPGSKKLDIYTWIGKVGLSFKNTFRDTFEVVIFVFFLTMDSTNLFFLPPELNVPLKATVFEYNLMVHGFVLNDHLRVTLAVVVTSIVIEIIRYGMKIINMSASYYWVAHEQMLASGIIQRRAIIIKNAIRKGFNDSKDSVLRFITFTTVLMLAFLMFPRLKLLAVAVTSVASIVLDIVIPQRLVMVKQQDLVSRIIYWVFRL